MVQQVIHLAEKAECRKAVFGGYVRDILMGNDHPEQLNDLDIFIEQQQEIKRVIETLSIFWELVSKKKLKQTNYGSIRTVTKCVFKYREAELSVDFVSFIEPPTNTNERSHREPFNPLCLQTLDFDVNTLFCPIQGTGMRSIEVAHPHLDIPHIVDRIKNKTFVTMTSPGDYEGGSIHGNAAKLVLRAEKMVLRGWTQDAHTGNHPDIKTGRATKTWFVSRWASIPDDKDKLEIPNITDLACWDSNRERILSTTHCGICHENFKAGQTVFVTPCGHPFHPCCTDYNADTSATAPPTPDRQKSGIVGWFVTGSRTKRSIAQPTCPMCNTNIFVPASLPTTISSSSNIVIGPHI